MNKSSFEFWPVNKSRFIYAIRCHDFIKIGRADSVEKRLTGMQVSNPYDLSIELALDVGLEKCREFEKRVHSAFEHLRVRGEWFRLENPLSEWIAESKKLGAMGAWGSEHVMSRFNAYWVPRARRLAKKVSRPLDSDPAGCYKAA